MWEKVVSAIRILVIENESEIDANKNYEICDYCHGTLV